MPALITGANGQLGRALCQLLPDARATDASQLDITDAAAVNAYDWADITAIYNAAAYTNVDGAETETVLAEQVNHIGVANLAQIARERNIPLIQISTDYVFDGAATELIPEDAPIHPESVYGKTKAGGEQAALKAPKHYIVRTSWVYGDGNNFVRTMLRLGANRDELTVVNDQYGRPTSAQDLAKALIELVEKPADYGVYNFQNSGEVITWANFAQAIFVEANLACKVAGITTSEYTEGKPGIAPRPVYSALALAKIESAGIRSRPWPEALKEYIDQEKSS